MRKRPSAAIWIRKLGDCWFAIALNDEGGLISSALSTKNEKDARASLSSNLFEYSQVEGRENSRADQLIEVLHDMYQGNSVSIDAELDMRFVTPFQQRVYCKTREIPRGRVTTYGCIAESLGSARLSRAVGRAMATNPFVLVVPCHRVVPSTLEVGNYGQGPRLKRGLLEREGVSFAGGKISKLSVWTPYRR